MIRKPISIYVQIALGIVSVVLLLGFYSILSHRQHLVNSRDTTIPSLYQIVHTTYKIITPDTNGKIWLLDDTKASFLRLGLGLAVGFILSCTVGIGMGCFKSAEAFFLPTLTFLTRVPATAMLAVFFVVVGTGEAMFVTMIAFGVMPTLTLAIYQSAKYDVHDESIYKAYTLGASTAEIIWNVVTQQIMPRIIESLRLQVGPALVYLIAAEFMMGDVGFGYRLRIQSRLLNMAVVYNYLMLLGITGFGLDWLLTWTRSWLCPWFARNK